MKLECTPQELKELLKKEQTECKSECSTKKVINIQISDKDIEYLKKMADKSVTNYQNALHHKHE